MDKQEFECPKCNGRFEYFNYSNLIAQLATASFKELEMNIGFQISSANTVEESFICPVCEEELADNVEDAKLLLIMKGVN